jgi:cathepsin L
MKKTLALLSILTSTNAKSLGNSDLTFEDYLQIYNKIYTSKEEVKSRRALFEATKQSIKYQNKLYQEGSSSWWAEINHLSDATDQELSQYGAKRAHSPHEIAKQSSLKGVAKRFQSINNNNNPSTKTWEKYQSPIKQQGSCGSCWAISTSEVLESHLAISENSTSPLVLSSQSLVDCTKNPRECGGSGGCGGATAEIGYNYTNSSGIPLTSSYPYTGKEGKCSEYKSAVTNAGYVKLQSNSADALEAAIANVGPVSVLVAANWQTYAGGIMADGCLSWLGSCNLDHVVVVVGYSPDYWLVRNSWGETWGENGYIRLTRKNDNTTYTDTDTSQGDGCKPFPKKQSVMGEGGVLFDMSYPNGVVRVK